MALNDTPDSESPEKWVQARGSEWSLKDER